MVGSHLELGERGWGEGVEREGEEIERGGDREEGVREVRGEG